MNTDIEVLLPEVVAKQLEQVEQAAGLIEDSAIALRGEFADYYNEIVTWRGKVAMITDAADPVQQKVAREIRLGLKDVRCNVERVRKSLKEESLKRGKAIDGFANVLKYLCEPVEAQLFDIEQYAERQEATRIAALVDHRTHELVCVGGNPAAYNLGQMDEATFATVLESETKAFEAREAALLKAEEDRKAKEKADAEERDRIQKENDRLKKEADDREAQLKIERDKREKAEREAADIKRKEDDRIAAEKKEADDKAKADKAAAAKAKRAPDREKIKQLVADLMLLELPVMTSTEGIILATEIEQKLNGFMRWIEQKAKEVL